MRKSLLVLMLVCCVLPLTVGGQSSSQNYSVSGANLNSGGSATMSSQNYRASTTLGQSSPVGIASSASYQVQIGVQYVYAAQGTSPSSNSFLLWTK